MTQKFQRISAICLVPILGGMLMAGCASTGADYQPIVDGPTDAAYQADLEDCQQLAQTRSYDNGDVRTSAAVGAGLGGIIGLADSGNLGEAAAGAVIGGLIGGGSETFETREERKEIVKNCMAGRGHRVVG